MKIAIISLGCPKNQVDADVFCHALIKDGHTTVADPAEADIIIINTCGFIESAKTEAIENILMACQYKQENPDLKVIVTGCLAERYKQQIIQEIPDGRCRCRHWLQRRAARHRSPRLCRRCGPDRELRP